MMIAMAVSLADDDGGTILREQFGVHQPSEAPPLTAEVDRSACSAMPRGSGWDRR